MGNRASRREFIRAGLWSTGAAALGLVALANCRRVGPAAALPELMGPLRAVGDEATGLPLLRLPEGFRYKTFAWAGSLLHDGYRSPPFADGMGAVRDEGDLVTLIRNHEVQGSSGPIGDPDTAYDVTEGGTTTLVFDTRAESLVDSWVSLGGTLYNCAGGVTPWGTWLSCEEAPWSPELAHLPPPFKQAGWELENARRDHGFVFEVPARGVARPEPIRAMGQMYHEAVAIDPRTGIAYMTEDQDPKAGFYRYLPDQPGKLAAGGRLQMMAVRGRRDLREQAFLGERLDTRWVDIPDPTRGFVPDRRDGDGLVRQGLDAGGTAFIGLEGCTFADGHVYFTSKYGGNARAGYIFEYDPVAEQLWLVYESPGHGAFSGPDNIVISPRGSLVVCEDRVTAFTEAQSIAGLTREGEFFRFCQINPELEGMHEGLDLAASVLQSEWAGVTFSADGEWLFANLYMPGITLAITGPWRDGLI